MNQEINMPEFINKPEEYINMTKEEYNQDRRFLIYAVRKECQREYQKMLFKRSICVLLLTIIGLCYVIWRINKIPDALFMQLPTQNFIETYYQH